MKKYINLICEQLFHILPAKIIFIFAVFICALHIIVLPFELIFFIKTASVFFLIKFCVFAVLAWWWFFISRNAYLKDKEKNEN